jgi:acetylcholinesterase/cholinesterase
VLLHYTIASSDQYYRGAIVESSPVAIPYKNFGEAMLLGADLARLLGCRPRDLACMRSKDSQAVAEAQWQTRSKVKIP